MKSAFIFFLIALIPSYYGVQGLGALNPKNQYDAHIHEKEQNMREDAVRRVMPNSQTTPEQNPQLGDAVQSYADLDQRNSQIQTECFDCMDCPHVRGNTSVKVCPLHHGKCVHYAEVYSFEDKPTYIRGCVLERGTCDVIKKLHENNDIKLLYCTECDGDRCNGGYRSLPDLFVALFFIFITPVVIKCTLS